MPLDTPQLILDLENASQQARQEKTLEAASQKYNELFAAALEKYIKTGTVTTVGSATTQTGEMT